MDSRFFTFNGVQSRQFGVHVVRIGGGRGEVTLWPSTTVSPVRNIKKPYIDAYEVDREPLMFSMTLMLMDEDGFPRAWTREDKSLVSSWLIHDEFKPLIFGHDPSKVYYAMLTEASPLQVTGQDGLIDVTMETNAPFGWTLPKIHREDCSDSYSTTIEIDAMHNVGKYYLPEIEVRMHGNDRVFRMINHTTQQITEVKGLLQGENFYINSENKVIESGRVMRNLFPQFNREFPRFSRGLNEIEIEGRCEVLIKTQYPIM